VTSVRLVVLRFLVSVETTVSSGDIIGGYEKHLEAMANPKHEEHDSYREWRRPFDPEAFDAQAATSEMRKGLPSWREMG
jgi:hypothetical protein